MDYNAFPSDIELINLIQGIYRNLKQRALRYHRITEDVAKLLNNYFEIKIIKIIDHYYESGYIQFLLYKNETTDSYSTEISVNEFQFKKLRKEDYKNKEEYELDEFHLQVANESFYDELLEPECDLNFYIPNSLLNQDAYFLSEYILNKFLLAESFSGLNLQQKVSMTRFQSILQKNKRKLITQISSLKSGDLNEKEKGIVIAEFFELLGYETLCIDELKEETFPQLNNVQDVDVVAFSFSTQSILLIEEKKKFTKKEYYKIKTLPFIFRIFPFLGEKHQWFVSCLIIGKCDESIKKDFAVMEKDVKLIFWELDEFIDKFEFFLNLKTEDFISPQPYKRKIEDMVDEKTGTTSFYDLFPQPSNYEKEYKWTLKELIGET